MTIINKASATVIIQIFKCLIQSINEICVLFSNKMHFKDIMITHYTASLKNQTDVLSCIFFVLPEDDVYWMLIISLIISPFLTTWSNTINIRIAVVFGDLEDSERSSVRVHLYMLVCYMTYKYNINQGPRKRLRKVEPKLLYQLVVLRPPWILQVDILFL